jgi:hypothetical protein
MTTTPFPVTLLPYYITIAITITMSKLEKLVYPYFNT